jgi:hypothetical protein
MPLSKESVPSPGAESSVTNPHIRASPSPQGVPELGQQLQYMHNFVLLEEVGCADNNLRRSVRWSGGRRVEGRD